MTKRRLLQKGPSCKPRRRFLAGGAAFAAALATRGAEAGVPGPSDLIGVWRQVGRGSGEAWTGLMIFTHGHFSRAMMKKDRPVLSFDFERDRSLTPEQRDQLIASMHEFRAFSGTYDITDGVLRFHSQVISNMAHTKAPIQRQLERQGNRLRLWGRTLSGGTAEELWEKIE